MPVQILVANYVTYFSPGGLTIGTTPQFYANWTANTTGLNALRTWIGGGGPSGKLTANTINATDTSGGALAKQTGALTINVTFGANNLYQNPGIGNLTLTGTGTSLDGDTVSQILGVASTALGAGTPENCAPPSALHSATLSLARRFLFTNAFGHACNSRLELLA